MKKIVNDNPQDNVGMMQNLAFIKDKEVWIRCGSKQGEDCTLIDFVNRACTEHRCEDATHLKALGHDFDNVGDMLMFCSGDGCPIGTFYYVACQAAELREYLRVYESKTEEIKDGEQE